MPPNNIQPRCRLPPEGGPSDPPKSKKGCPPCSKSKGERGFIEGCLFALCCCWLCDACV